MLGIEFSSLTDNAAIELAAKKLNTNLPEWEKSIWLFVQDWFNPEVRAITIYTSGSTGAPKPVEHSKIAMLNSAKMTCQALRLQKGDTALLCLPANKIAGMMMLVRSIYSGMNVLCFKPTSTPLNDLPKQSKIAFAAFTPMQLYSAVKNYEQFRKAEQIDKIILGGDRISAEVLQMITRFGNEVYSTFGMTETISHIALKRLNGTNADSHYRIIGDINISVNDRSCLVIDAPALGQLHLVTNDVVKLISDKEFDWLGRADNMINCGGVKINPEELEQKLQAHIQPAFFIASIPDERTGESLVLAIETIVLSESDRQELKEVLATFDKLHRPKSVLLFNQFSRTTNGKIQRKETLGKAFETVALY